MSLCEARKIALMETQVDLRHQVERLAEAGLKILAVERSLAFLFGGPDRREIGRLRLEDQAEFDQPHGVL